jgi:hypothetical protein
MQSPEVAYLLACAHVLSLHPPARPAAGQRLDAFLSGSPLVLD